MKIVAGSCWGSPTNTAWRHPDACDKAAIVAMGRDPTSLPTPRGISVDGSVLWAASSTTTTSKEVASSSTREPAEFRVVNTKCALSINDASRAVRQISLSSRDWLKAVLLAYSDRFSSFSRSSSSSRRRMTSWLYVRISGMESTGTVRTRPLSGPVPSSSGKMGGSHCVDLLR
eukprot:scaffold263_cov251-Pinguiococcus_pyrenoidosus.AAC.15